MRTLGGFFWAVLGLVLAATTVLSRIGEAATVNHNEALVRDGK